MIEGSTARRAAVVRRFIKGFTCGWMFGKLEKTVDFWLEDPFRHSTDNCVYRLSTLEKY